MNDSNVIAEIQASSMRLNGISDFDTIIDSIGSSKYVLLGEASHGTSEFYRLRAELSKRLILEHGFTFIAVEGDFPSCFALNRYVKGDKNTPSTAKQAMKIFQRWPTWMWANEEIASFLEWMKVENSPRGSNRQVGFYGIDMYSLWESMDEIVKHLERIQAPELEDVKKAFSCFEPYGRNAQTYGLSATYMSEHCEDEVVKALLELRSHRQHDPSHPESTMALDLNAMVTLNAERYYRAMFHPGPESWNVRDTHMVKALERIMAFHGDNAKCIVWEHNTHIGDARFTDMIDEGMVNVGQLLRERHGTEEVFPIGFGTHRGTVIAGSEWGAPMQVMPVPNAQPGSWEDLMHRAGDFNQLLLFKDRDWSLDDPLPHRAIGVVYEPLDERGNYVPTIMHRRYDAFVFVEETQALRPIELARVEV
ncbi:erythromycin esterase family protein [Alicyclobacillus dauci]|uniref:Erythromycin esterase family protein n=1 Tax=Alicyclobacillus dauci TaxID=1475485 RepID=A0ABY6Z5Y0_9BACL|nr:erythromycin esterase family protein [Alicyclobacillus dauci]WAH38017.1 erythromycin esterase family protein [Alicyclobacillus dauci]